MTHSSTPKTYIVNKTCVWTYNIEVNDNNIQQYKIHTANYKIISLWLIPYWRRKLTVNYS